MPNHISNRIKFEKTSNNWRRVCEALDQLKVLMKTEDSPFDFNALIPYPKDWDDADEKHHIAVEEINTRLSAVGDDKEKRQAIMLEWKDLPEDGYNHGGYEWCIANWGTKWNAYEIGFDCDAILFQTAWNTPRPIWAEISKRFPDLELVVEYADEDRGSNCGILKYNAGHLVEETLYGKEAATSFAILFARAIIAEQEAAAYKRDLEELKSKQEQTPAHTGAA